MQQAAPYLETLAKKDPQFGSRVSADRDFILADGALSAKTKALMALLCDSLLAHEHGVSLVGDRARSLGATEAEIAETVRMAYWMGGIPALITGSNAFSD